MNTGGIHTAVTSTERGWMQAESLLVWVKKGRDQREAVCAGALYLLEAVVQVQDGCLQALVAQEKLHLTDVEAQAKPALRGEPAQAVRRVWGTDGGPV